MRAVTIAAALALAPATAAAQAGTVKVPPPAEAAPQAQPAAEAPAPVEGAGAVPAGGAVPPPDTYTVKPGDTLWDLSGRFLNNPWYWPKVWSYNPEITNPHWISPGNVIRFFPGTEEAPARIEQVPVAEGEAPTEDMVPPKELDDFSKADMKRPQDFGDEDAVAVTGPYKVGYVAPKGVMARRDTFVTVRELAESGVITAAFEDKALLSIQDKIYARFKDPAAAQVGQRYVLFRTVRPIESPTTGARIGYQTRIVGTARAVARDDRQTTLIVQEASDPIERGDFVGPQAERTLKMIARRPNQRHMEGRIVAAEHAGTWLAGEHHVVFVDKGRADGVEEGNVFTVTRAGDPYGQPLDMKTMALREDRKLPAEDIGELLVLDAKENFSTTLVVKSLRELFAGDHVVMRSGAPGGK